MSLWDIFLEREKVVWESSRGKRHNSIINIKKRFRGILESCKSRHNLEVKIMEAKLSATASVTTKAKYKIKQERRIEVVFSELSNLLLYSNENFCRSREYHEKRLYLLSKLIFFIQPMEKRSNTQLHKVQQRISGYTKMLTGALHARNNADIDLEIGATIWEIQKRIAVIVGAAVTPSVTPSNILESENTSPIIILMNLQMLGLFCDRFQFSSSSSSSSTTASSTTTTKYNPTNLSNILCFLTNTLINLPTYTTSFNEISITLIITQLLKTLSSLLRVMKITAKSSEEFDDWFWTGFSSLDMIKQLCYWCDLLRNVRLGMPSSSSNNNNNNNSNNNSNSNNINIKNNNLLKSALQSMSSCACTALSDGLTCLTYLIKTTATRLQQTQSQSQSVDSIIECRNMILATALSSAVIAIQQHSLSLSGDFPSATGDIRYVEAMERECIVALEVATTCLSMDMVNDQIFGIIRMGYEIAVLHPMSLPLQDHILTVLRLHQTTGSIQWLGLIIIRMLTRLPYMNPRDVDLLLIRHALDDEEANTPVAVGMTSIGIGSASGSVTQTPVENSGADTMMMFSEKSDQGGSVSVSTQDDSSVGTIPPHGVAPASMLTLLYQQLIDDEDNNNYNNNNNNISSSSTNNNNNAMANKPFLSLLRQCGLLHVQSDQVLEQWLLLVHQLGHSSYSAKLNMADAGIHDCLKQVLVLRSDNASTYILALAELCADFIGEETAML
eukprot:gene9824-20432_t